MSRLVMPQRIAPIPAPGSLLKRPREAAERPAGNARALPNPSYLAAIRALPCLKCGLEPAGEAAHVRLNSAALGKRQALGRRPDDRWALPLCPSCHRIDADSQHKLGEAEFWHRMRMNPLLVCLRLATAAADPVRMRAVVLSAIAERGR